MFFFFNSLRLLERLHKSFKYLNIHGIVKKNNWFIYISELALLTGISVVSVHSVEAEEPWSSGYFICLVTFRSEVQIRGGVTYFIHIFYRQKRKDTNTHICQIFIPIGSSDQHFAFLGQSMHSVTHTSLDTFL